MTHIQTLGGLSQAALDSTYARLVGVQPTRTTDGAVVVGRHNPVDATSGNRTVTLADAASAGLLVAVSKKDASANTVTVSVAHLRDGGAGSITLVGQYEALLLTSKADGTWWPVGDHKTKAYLDAAYKTPTDNLRSLSDSTFLTALNNAYVGFVKASADTSGATDTAALQAKIDAGGVVNLQGGATYYVSGLVLKSNAHLFLNGATLMLPAGANADVIVTNGFASLTGTGTGLIGSGIRHAGIYGPGIIDGNKANQTISNTTVAAGSDGAVLPQSTINVASTTSYPSSGTVTIRSSTGIWTITYTGKTSTSFTGCTGGAGTINTGTLVVAAGFGIRAYWSDCVLGGIGGLEVRNCIADGAWLEWGTGTDATVKADGSMENDTNSLKSYSNGRNGLTVAGPHDSSMSKVIVFGNAIAGMVIHSGGTCYVTQFHAWGSPQIIGADVFSETHFGGANVCEVAGTTGSMGLRINGVVCTYYGRILNAGLTTSGGIGIVLQGSPSGCNVDADIIDCTQAALLVVSDGGKNRIRLQTRQTVGPAIARLVVLTASGSNGIDVSTFAGAGTLNVTTSTNFSGGTTNFPASGAVMVQTANGSQLVTYTGKTSTTLTGCTSSGSGALFTGGTVVVVNQISGGAANDTGNISTSSVYQVDTMGGTTAKPYHSNRLVRKATGAITLSATANTYAAGVDVTPSGVGVALPLGALNFTVSSIGTETITTQVTATYDDGTTSGAAVHSTSANTTIKADAGDYYTLGTNGRHVVKLNFTAKSSIANSTAVVSYQYAA